MPDTLDLAVRVAALEAELDGPGWIAAVGDLRGELRAAKGLPDAFPEPAPAGDDLATEVAPWAAAACREADAGLAALRLLQCARPVAQVDAAGRGRAFAPDPETAMHTAFMVLYVWKGARTDEKVVFGPRFAIYTPVVQLPDGAPALDAGAAVREDASAIDQLCRLALRTYDGWRTTAAGTPLRVLVDGEERPVAADGSFDGRGRMVLVRQGPWCTRVTPGEPPPFSDRRIA